MKRKNIFTALVSIISFLSIAFSFPQKNNQLKRNLKVLPENISNQKLDSIMQSYCIALGVQCNFCHIKNDNYIDTASFSLDTNPMKDNARDMMRMTIDINSKYFYFDKTIKPEFLNIVACNTCHHGQAFFEK